MSKTSSAQVGTPQSFAEAAQCSAFVVPGDEWAPRAARLELQRRVRRALDRGALETLTLLVSEAVTNCVERAGAVQASPIEISATVRRRVVHVEVSSEGAQAFEPEPSAWRPDDPNVRELFLIEALAERWGIESEPRAALWFEVQRWSRRPGAPARESRFTGALARLCGRGEERERNLSAKLRSYV